MSDLILLCTVGGSHQPILKAIRHLRPRYVCFICTGPDPETGHPGSQGQVTDSGNVVKARPGDAKPSRPNIPTQAGLKSGQFETVIVQADDLDDAFIVIRNTISDLGHRFPAARFVADYTGGTKTMTAALVCATLESDSIELQLVAGARPDLDRVRDGTEQPMVAGVARLRLDRAMKPFLSAWTRYSYAEAAEGLDGIRIGIGSPDRTRLALARALSHALARWDNFDHSGALERIELYQSPVAKSFPRMLPTLRLLTQKDKPQYEPARLFDLWLNAARRASQGRFDDAVARCYRLIEWVAQWQLRSKLGIDTARFPVDRLPKGADAHAAANGTVMGGLVTSWQAIGELLDGPPQTFAIDCLNSIRDLVSIRNGSILAHGFLPVQARDWERMEAWVNKRFLPVLRKTAAEVGLRREPSQLPTAPPKAVSDISSSRDWY